MLSCQMLWLLRLSLSRTTSPLFFPLPRKLTTLKVCSCRISLRLLLTVPEAIDAVSELCASMQFDGQTLALIAAGFNFQFTPPSEAPGWPQHATALHAGQSDYQMASPSSQDAMNTPTLTHASGFSSPASEPQELDSDSDSESESESDYIPDFTRDGVKNWQKMPEREVYPNPEEDQAFDPYVHGVPDDADEVEDAESSSEEGMRACANIYTLDLP
jgi:hypothetical protein